MVKLPTFASFFCGCGGLDLGFEQAGFVGRAAYDIDSDAVAVHNHNLKTRAHVCDLNQASFPKNKILRPDVVIAGPPCQGFSTLGKRMLDDPRNSLVVTAAQLAVRHQPQVIVLENVAGAMSGPHATYWHQAERVISNAGYKSVTQQLVSADYGVPQIRRRVVLIAWKSKSDTAPLIGLGKKITLSSTLRSLDGVGNHEPKHLKRGSDEYAIAMQIKPHQKLCNVRGGDRAVPTWEIPNVFGETTAAERDALVMIQKLRRQLRRRDHGDADPLSLSDISEHCGRDATTTVKRLLTKGYLRKIGQRFDLAHTFNGKYRRLAWEHVAPAVDTRFGEPRYFLHPEEHRGLSVREAARIQGFPDDFVFTGPRSAQFRMVGNAVPPPLARQIALAIRDQLL